MHLLWYTNARSASADARSASADALAVHLLRAAQQRLRDLLRRYHLRWSLLLVPEQRD